MPYRDLYLDSEARHAMDRRVYFAIGLILGYLFGFSASGSIAFALRWWFDL